jgi:energy-coupling factor transporter ATP-binding protein EcfA2
MSVSWPLSWIYGDRICIIGPSGSGKTRLMKAVMKQKSHVVVIDTKQDSKEHWEREGVVTKKLAGLRGGRYIWKATDDFIADPADQSKVFEMLLKSGPRVVVIDEGYSIFTTRGARLFATQGRGKRVSFVFGTQRPRAVPVFFISDANFWIIFHLVKKEDQKVVEDAVGQKIPWDVLRKARYSFVIFNARGDMGGPWTLPPP